MPPAAAVAVRHVVPLSSETCTTSPVPSGSLNVPEMVCAATLVTKSVALDPDVSREGDAGDMPDEHDCDVIFAQPGEREIQHISRPGS